MKKANQTSQKRIKKLPLLLLALFTVIMVIISMIITANNLMKYITVKEQNEVLQTIHDNKVIQIDELKYYIDTEIDDEYKERMARIMGYCFPDETIYYVE